MKSDQVQLHAEIEEKHWWFLGRREIMRRLVHRLVPGSKSSTVVDVGCGTGGNIAALVNDYSCVGIDTSNEAIESARRRFPEVRFICGSAIGHLAELRDEAELCLLMDVLEHVEDDAGFLTKIVGVIRPGAHVLLTVPAGMSLWSQHDVSFGHYRRYDLAALRRLWEGLPVTPRLVSYYNTFLYPFVKVLRGLSRWRGRAWGDAGTDFRVPMWPVNGIMEGVFAREGALLVNVLDGRRERGFSYGVSLIAVLRREPGAVLLPKKSRAILREHGDPEGWHGR